MASFKSILGDIGHGLRVFFLDATKVAKVAEPIVDLAFPGIAVLFNATVNAAIVSESAAIAASKQNGSGEQKLALAVAGILPAFQQYAAANGLPTPTISVVTNWTNAIVAALNSIPAATQAPVQSTVTSTPTTTPTA